MRPLPTALLLVSLCTPALAENPVIPESRKLLYTNRDQAIEILEDALARDPKDVDLWVAYVHSLTVGSDHVLPDLAARHALALHPGDPRLLLAHARAHNDGLSIDILGQLARVNGYEKLARDYAEQVALGLHMPSPEERPSADRPTVWADRLIVLGRTDRAAIVLGEGLAHFKASPSLLARRAVVEALSGEFDKALGTQAEAGFAQEVIADTWYGPADMLLAKNKPDLALKSFGNKRPTPPEHLSAKTAPNDYDSPVRNAHEFRRVYARALARTGDVDGALALLAGDRTADRLLRLRVLLMARRVDDARKLGEEIVGPMRLEQGSRGGPWLSSYWGPRSLEDEHVLAVQWLRDEFPAKRDIIGDRLGTDSARERQWRSRRGWSVVTALSEAVPSRERILDALESRPQSPEAKRAAAEGWTVESVRRTLAEYYAKLGRYDDAAKALVPPIIAPGRGAAALHDAVAWSVHRRRGELDELAARDFAALVIARRLVAAPTARRWNHRRTDGRDWPGDAAVIEGLAKLGPAVLPLVVPRLGPNTISGEDRRVWVEIIRRIATEQDTPPLIATLSLLAREAGNRPHADQVHNDDLSAEAIHAALQAVTKREGPKEQTWAARARFWGSWWAEEAARIVGAK
ncbi:MAG TPA: hypothetical protein VEA69_25745 [Tepidisphaeraceae bacterium]|nr:hypothetical protein [Tepidisphaeraceae bacterium]